MTIHYTEETRKILANFLELLNEDSEVDPVFLHELASMVQSGELGNSVRIEKALDLPRSRPHGIQD